MGNKMNSKQNQDWENPLKFEKQSKLYWDCSQTTEETERLEFRSM